MYYNQYQVGYWGLQTTMKLSYKLTGFHLGPWGTAGRKELGRSPVETKKGAHHGP